MKGKITISGKVYECEVRNGVRYVDGKTVPEFAKTLSLSELMDLAIVGAMAVDAEKEGRFIPAQMIGDFGDDCYDSFKNAVVHDKAGWHNKMFVQADLMPHRIQITDLRIERLQDISGDDCLNEGIFVNEYIKNGKMRYHYGFDGFLHEREGWFAQKWFNKPREAFASLIDKVSGRGTWDRNPFVWRIEFELVK